jgi:molybdate transport system permease protein
MSASDWSAVSVTLSLAFVTAVLLLLIAIPLSWKLAHTRSKLKPVGLSLIALPLVLPPTVLGFYLLILFSPSEPLGATWQALFGQPLAFSFSALVIGSVLYSLPFAVQPLYAGFSQFNQDMLVEAQLLNLPRKTVWKRIILPAMKPSLVIAFGLSFAHTLGEFGVVLMIGGSIEGSTRVVSIALFEHVESLQFAKAHLLAGLLTAFSFLLLVVLYSMSKSRKAGWSWI